MLTAPRATEMPSVYLWIYLLSKSFNWEDDSKINILERCQLHPPPPPVLLHISSPAPRPRGVANIKILDGSQEKSNFPPRRLFLGSRFNIIFFVFLSVLFSLINWGDPHYTSGNIICCCGFFIR